MPPPAVWGVDNVQGAPCRPAVGLPGGPSRQIVIYPRRADKKNSFRKASFPEAKGGAWGNACLGRLEGEGERPAPGSCGKNSTGRLFCARASRGMHLDTGSVLRLDICDSTASTIGHTLACLTSSRCHCKERLLLAGCRKMLPEDALGDLAERVLAGVDRSNGWSVRL